MKIAIIVERVGNVDMYKMHSVFIRPHLLLLVRISSSGLFQFRNNIQNYDCLQTRHYSLNGEPSYFRATHYRGKRSTRRNKADIHKFPVRNCKRK